MLQVHRGENVGCALKVLGVSGMRLGRNGKQLRKNLAGVLDLREIPESGQVHRDGLLLEAGFPKGLFQVEKSKLPELSIPGVNLYVTRNQGKGFQPSAEESGLLFDRIVFARIFKAQLAAKRFEFGTRFLAKPAQRARVGNAFLDGTVSGKNREGQIRGLVLGKLLPERKKPLHFRFKAFPVGVLELPVLSEQV